MARPDDFAQLKLTFVDHMQWRYEIIRPVVPLQHTTPQQRAHETQTHSFTVRRLVRQFRERGMLGLLPGPLEVVGTRGAPRLPEAIRHEIHHLKALYNGFHYRELSRILLITCGYRVYHKTVKAIWQESALSLQGQLDLCDYHGEARILQMPLKRSVRLPIDHQRSVRLPIDHQTIASRQGES